MPWRLTLTAAALLTVATLRAAGGVSIDFESLPMGVPPENFAFAASRMPAPGLWEVRGATKNHHLVHPADRSVTVRALSIAMPDVLAPASIKLAVKMRLVDNDRAAGLVWRFRDANNFYFTSIFLGARSATLIRVSDGNRIMLDQVQNIEPDADAWHTLTVVHDGDQIRVNLNGIGIMRARDAVLTDGGRAGVWSAGNSTTMFDDLSLEEVPD